MKTSHSKYEYKYTDQTKLNALTDLAIQNIDKIYDYFNTEIDHIKIIF